MPLYCFHIPPTTLNPNHFHQNPTKSSAPTMRKGSCNGTIVQQGPPGPICTDTRTLEPGQWFFAIRGENFDAHEFITPELGHKGCVGVIGNWVCPNWDKGFVEMGGDSLTSLEKMANYARNKFHGCLVGFWSWEWIEEEIMELARMRRLQWQREILAEAKPGMCVLNADDPLVVSLPVPHGVLFGQRLECDVRFAAEKVHGGHGVRVVLERNHEKVEFVIPSPGLHLAQNACATAAVAVALGVSLPQVGISLSRFIPVSMRSELEVAKTGIKIINDVYNANPVSTKAAIELLKNIDCKGKRVAILGDMLELGQAETVSHEMMLSLCCDSHFDLIALVGKRFLRAAENLNLVGERNLLYSPDAESLAFEIVQRLNRNDVILVKGSRGMQMEKVVAAIKAMNLGFPHE
ncbi:hypothetical protein AAG906_009010 [Vitis piasezkii]